jgi:hypothetical protein
MDRGFLGFRNLRDLHRAGRKGGNVPLGYYVKDRKLTVNEPEASTVQVIFPRYAELGFLPK